MKNVLKFSKFLFTALLLTAMFTACQKEDTDPIEENETTENQVITDGGNAVSGMDWDDDDDYEGDCEELCFEFNYPITLQFGDGTTKEVNSDEELETAIDTYYQNNPNDSTDVNFQYPIEVTLEDGTIQTVKSDEDFFLLLEDCFGDEWDNDDDDDDEWEDDFELCFDIVFPLTVELPDGTTQTANDEEELEVIFETWFENNPNDSLNYPMIVFPITVELEDGTTQELNNEEELEALFETCFDGDMGFGECFTLNFPVTIINPDSTQVEVASEEELFTLIEAWFEANPDSEECPHLAFPVTVTLEDGTEQTVNNEEELEELFEECYDDWDGLVSGNDLMLNPKAIAAKVALKK